MVTILKGNMDFGNFKQVFCFYMHVFQVFTYQDYSCKFKNICYSIIYLDNKEVTFSLPSNLIHYIAIYCISYIICQRCMILTLMTYNKLICFNGIFLEIHFCL